MGSITSWLRLEPRCRDDDMAQAVQARIHDPLWLLARQWQVAEFEGEDAGSPVVARWRASTAPLTRFAPGALPTGARVDGMRFDVAEMPLEARVERQRVRATPASDDGRSLRLSVEGGLHFLRVLQAQATSKSYRDAFLAHFALMPPTAVQRAQCDAQTLSYWELMAGRVPDGRRLAIALRGPDRAALTDAMQVAPGDRAEVEKALGEWLAGVEALFTQPPGNDDAWDAERLEYAFSAAAAPAGEEVVLTAAEYFEGHLDWYSVDVDSAARLGAGVDRAAGDVVRTVVPAPVTFRGSPAPRFWEFEDARIDYGLLPAGPGDLPHLMLSEFATAFGNDWYVVPVELPIGTLSVTRSLVIVDTFGVRTLVQPLGAGGAASDGWSMYQLARRASAGTATGAPVANLFYLAPALWKAVEGRATEEVRFMRDEMVNMAWAVEHAVQGRLEQRIDLSALAVADPSPDGMAAQATADATLPRYRLATDVPANWIPLLPQRRVMPDGTSQRRLVRAAMLSPDGSNRVRPARSDVLRAGSAALALFDEEVPRDGLRVTQAFQLARWIGGTTVLWLGRRKQAGRGEGSSGLRFDQVEE